MRNTDLDHVTLCHIRKTFHPYMWHTASIKSCYILLIVWKLYWFSIVLFEMIFLLSSYCISDAFKTKLNFKCVHKQSSNFAKIYNLQNLNSHALCLSQALYYAGVPVVKLASTTTYHQASWCGHAFNTTVGQFGKINDMGSQVDPAENGHQKSVLEKWRQPV